MKERRPRLTEDEYLRQVESLAKEVIGAAIDEGSFEVFREEGTKTSLQQAITRLAQSLLYVHYEGDGCIPGEEPTGPSATSRGPE